MTSEVGSGQVAIFPTFRGFRRAVSTQVDGTATEAARGFSRGMSTAGTTAGRGFSRSFTANTRDVGQGTIAALTEAVRKSSVQVSAARLKEQDAAGKVRVAEAALAEARARGGAQTARSVAAEERLASAQRGLTTVQQTTAASTTRLQESQRQLATATAEASASAGRSGRGFLGFARTVRSSGDSASRGFGRALSTMRSSSDRTVGAMGHSFKSLAITLAAVFSIRAIADWSKEQVASLGRIESINAQTTSAIKATGGAAGVTAKHVEDLTGSLENQTGTEAESIQIGANLLLTFKNLRNGVGAGNDIFDQTTRIMTDMARAMGTDPQASAIQLGKALNDPVKGIAALSRVGVTFSDDQKKVIKSLVATGDTMGAQKIILQELNSEFGGSGQAYAKTYAGKITLLGHAWGTFGETLFTNVNPALGGVASTLTGLLNNVITPAIPKITGPLTSAFGTAKSAVLDFVGGFRGGGEAIQTFYSPMSKLGADVNRALAPLGAAVKTAFDSVKSSLPDLGATFGPLIPQILQLATAFSPLGIVLTAIGPQLGPLAVSLGTLLGGALTAVLPLVAQLSGILVVLLSTVATGVLPAITALATFLGNNAGVVTAFAVAVGGGVLAYKAYSAILTVIAAKSKIAAIAQAALNLVMSLNPIGLIIAAIAALAIGLTLFFTKTKTGQKIWAAFTGALVVAFNAAKAGISIAVAVIASIINTRIAEARAIVATLVGAAHAMAAGVGAALSAVGRFFGNLGSTASARVGEVVGFFASLPGRITGAIGDLGGLLVGIGRNVVQGLLNGISNAGGALSGVVQGLVNKIPAVARKALGIHSPSRVMDALGRFTGQGFAQGIRGTADQVASAMTSLSNKVLDAAKTKVTTKTLVKRAVAAQKAVYKVTTTSEKKLQSTLVGLNAKGQAIYTKRIVTVSKQHKTLVKAATKATKAVYKTTTAPLITSAQNAVVQRLIKKTNGTLTSLAKQRAVIADKLKAATDKLSDAVKVRDDFAASVSSSVVSRGDITGSSTSADMIANLKKQISDTKLFTTTLAKLRALGLDKTSYEQLASKGVDALAQAQALAAGGKGAVKNVAALQGQLLAAGNALGSATSKTLYQAGVDSAKGLVDGIASQEAALTKAMDGIADKLVAAIKNKLKIHSPSRVFRDEIGKNIAAGVGVGLDAGSPAVQAKIRDLVTVPTSLSRTGSAAALRVATTATSSGVSSPTASKSDRPIYMDGSLFGILRELANGEAQILINKNNADANAALTTGLQRGK